MRKIVKTIIIIALVTLGLSYLFNPFDSISVQDGKQVVSQVSKNHDVDLGLFLTQFKNNQYQEIELIGDEKLIGKKELGRSLLMKSNSLGQDIYKQDLETYTTYKPKSTSLNDLGVIGSGLGGTGFTKIIINNNEGSFLGKLLVEDLLPFLIIFGLFMFLLNKFGPKGGMPFGIKLGTGNKKDQSISSKTTFKDVAGMEEVKQELAEIVDFLKHSEKYTKVGARIPKGVLLYGAPGCGKTLLARAVAGEAGVPFYSASGSEFMEMLVGMGAAKVRELFGKAKTTAPSIIFIDEIDAIGKKRGSGHTGGHQEQEQTLNQILTEMDGFEQGTNVIVMAATNRPDTLDPALLRSGRFDRKIMVSNPTLEERVEIINYYLTNKTVDPNYNLESLARRLSGFVGADIENIVNEAALKVAREERTTLIESDFEYGFEKTLMGPEKKIKTLKEKERKIVTYHELGHAVVSHLLPNCDPVEKISIVSRGMALGVTWFSSQEDSYLRSKAKFLDDISGLLGGRAAEEVFFGSEQITTGASNDFEKVTKMVYDMVTKYGMYTEIGTLNLSNDDYSITKPYSEKTAELIDQLVKKIVEEQYNQAVTLIQSKKHDITIMAGVLYQKEYLTKEEFEKLMNAGDDIESIASSL
ncbi:MAG TPA: ATP-dependent zinc metalloprotease FtsH [Candidatus Absconditabacterales bacterium]|nr:ATP-dependent zinc metalloprotease FtsH [Candidatus Absconditabacterales bacterium]